MSWFMLHFLWKHFTTYFTIPRDIDLTGRVCLVTGANQGLGYEIAVHFARLNASRIIIASRQLKTCQEAAANIYRAVPSYRGKIDAWQVDLMSFASVQAFARRVVSECDMLDIAVLNAATAPFSWNVTPDGWEETLQVNSLSTGLLATLLLPKLVHASGNLLPLIPAPGKKGLEKPHLVILTSDAHNGVNFSLLDTPGPLLVTLNDEKVIGAPAYTMSKLLDVFLTRKMAYLPAASGKVVVNCVDPGLCKSGLRRDMPFSAAFIWDLISWRAEFGARNSVIAAVTTTSAGAYISQGEEMEVNPFVTSEKGSLVQERLWDEAVEVWRKAAPEISASL